MKIIIILILVLNIICNLFSNIVIDYFTRKHFIYIRADNRLFKHSILVIKFGSLLIAIILILAKL